MKLGKDEAAAVATTSEEVKRASAAAKRELAKQKKLEQDLAGDIWYQTTKIVVPAWFGFGDVEEGIKLNQTFTAAGLLALVAVGQASRDERETSTRSACEVSMQIKLRSSVFDREEARRLAYCGFSELRQLKLVRQVTKPTKKFPYPYYVLSVKGIKWYELLERSAGCSVKSGVGR